MKKHKELSTKSKWDSLIKFVSSKFGNGNKLDLQAVLFLIGINELGQGYRDFTSEEKTNLLHIAICRLLSRYGYYHFNGRDKDGWPHWTTKNLPKKLSSNQQNNLLKESAIIYFNDAGIGFN
ncbi:MAG: hypothetical protein CMP65_04515 [Flavobacteriales bacterium]|nr:hypothetical protein [Flavobacteriales bacterium]